MVEQVWIWQTSLSLQGIALKKMDERSEHWGYCSSKTRFVCLAILKRQLPLSEAMVCLQTIPSQGVEQGSNKRHVFTNRPSIDTLALVWLLQQRCCFSFLDPVFGCLLWSLA